MNCPFKVTTQHLSWISVWPLTRPLQTLDLGFFFLFYSFIFFSAIHRWTCWCVSDHYPAAEVLFMLKAMNWRPDVLLQDILVDIRIRGCINHRKSSTSRMFRDVSWQQWDEPLCSFWPCNPPVMTFLLSMFLMNESWTLTSTGACEVYSCLDVGWVIVAHSGRFL